MFSVFSSDLAHLIFDMLFRVPHLFFFVLGCNGFCFAAAKHLNVTELNLLLFLLFIIEVFIFSSTLKKSKHIKVYFFQLCMVAILDFYKKCQQGVKENLRVYLHNEVLLQFMPFIQYCLE
jgi:hypothetical protein